MNGAIVFFVVFVAALLLCTPRGERRLAAACMAMVGGAIWLAVRIRAHSVLGDLIGSLLGAAWEHREWIVFALAATVVLIAPIAMLWMALGEHFARRATSQSRKRIGGEGESISWHRRM